jgi:hypothetical protein
MARRRRARPGSQRQAERLASWEGLTVNELVEHLIAKYNKNWYDSSVAALVAA